MVIIGVLVSYLSDLFLQMKMDGTFLENEKSSRELK